MKSDLGHCPFCWSTDIDPELATGYTAGDGDMGQRLIYTGCNNCRACGPGKPTVEEAVAAWFRGAMPVPVPVENQLLDLRAEHMKNVNANFESNLLSASIAYAWSILNRVGAVWHLSDEGIVARALINVTSDRRHYFGQLCHELANKDSKLRQLRDELAMLEAHLGPDSEDGPWAEGWAERSGEKADA